MQTEILHRSIVVEVCGRYDVRKEFEYYFQIKKYQNQEVKLEKEIVAEYVYSKWDPEYWWIGNISSVYIIDPMFEKEPRFVLDLTGEKPTMIY